MKDITIKLDSGREIVLTREEAEELYRDLAFRFGPMSIPSAWTETEQPCSTITVTPGSGWVIKTSSGSANIKRDG